MTHRLLPLSMSLVLALAVAGGAHAQSVGKTKVADTAVLPVVNNGKVEGYLVLEPTEMSGLSSGHRFGLGALGAAFDAGNGNSLGLLCNGRSGVFGTIGNLANNCQLANFDGRSSAGAVLQRGGNKVGMTAGSGRDSLPPWLMPGAVTPDSNKSEFNELAVFGRKALPGEWFVSFEGTVAKARLLSPAAAEASGLDTDRWTTRSFAVGGGVGNFGANIVGQVVDMPGQQKWEGVGLGVTWRTPWSGQLSVGADNIITRGKNPFAPSTAGKDKDEGAVPYVRYEQDL